MEVDEVDDDNSSVEQESEIDPMEESDDDNDGNFDEIVQGIMIRRRNARFEEIVDDPIDPYSLLPHNNPLTMEVIEVEGRYFPPPPLPDYCRRKFSDEFPIAHSYLFSEEDTVYTPMVRQLNENQEYTLPTFGAYNVIFPGDTLPIVVRRSPEMTRFKDYGDNEQFIVMETSKLSNYYTHIRERPNSKFIKPRIASVLKVIRYCFSSNRKKLHCELKCFYRCKILEKHSIDDLSKSLNVKILPETVLKDPNMQFLPSFARKMNYGNKKRSLMMTHGQFSDFSFGKSTTNNCEIICEKLENLFDISRPLNILERQGITDFSYWCIPSLPIGIEEKYQLLKEESADARVQQIATYLERISLMCCKYCRSVIFFTRDMIAVFGEGSGRHFVNPSSVVFDVITVKNAINYTEIGTPQFEFGWFPGYSWQNIECFRCSAHLGWKYVSNHLLPKQFIGIVRETVFPMIKNIEEL